VADRRVRVNLAGQNFGFSLPNLEAEDSAEETQSVLSQYFPELKLVFGAKTQRGGRLGRSNVSVTPELTLRQREAAVAGSAAPISTSVQQPGSTREKRIPSTEFGQSSIYFGGEDYWRNIERGVTPQEIKEWAQSNPQLFRDQNVKGNEEGLYEQIMRGNVRVESAMTPRGTATTGNQPSNSPRESAIQDIYKNVLGRQADVGGLKTYNESLMGIEGIRKEIEQSPERRVQQLNTLYREVLGREADPSGIETYTRQDPRAEGGFTQEELESLKQDLFSSAEYKAKNQGKEQQKAPEAPPSSPRESAIQDIYKNVLGRQADVGGLKTYNESSMNIEDIRKEIEQSPERRVQQLNTLYREVLGREADPSGIETYTRQDPRAEGGFTQEELESLKQDLFSSAEYKAKNR
jgi:hypothetical protein